jgi:uncharacterized protein (TIGR02646 family)
MRYIDLELIELEIKSDWTERATRAVDNIVKAPKEKRADAINRRQKLWKDFKDLLRIASENKCWYCETIERRTDNAVDHFRPKNRVIEAIDKDHAGYWWLAFDWRNYRFSCSYCNSPHKGPDGTFGKHHHFPLLDENKRAKSPGDSLDDEEPLLLDPTNIDDVTEITFGFDGRAVPRAIKKNSVQYRRAERTIDIYHLNHPQIVEFRARLMRQVRKHLSEADRFAEIAGPSAKHSLRRELGYVMKAMKPTSEYSAAARTVVGSARGISFQARLLFNVA